MRPRVVGVYCTPLISYDPKFNLARKNTPRGKKILEELIAALARFRSSETCINYVKRNKNFCGESLDMYKHFLASYTFHIEMLMLHDGGTAYKVGKKSIFDEVGLPNHKILPKRVLSVFISQRHEFARLQIEVG